MRWAGRRWREQREAGWAPAEAAATVLKASDSRFLRLLGACGAWTEGQGRGRNPEGGEERALAPGYSDGVSRAATPFCGAGSRRTRGLPGARGVGCAWTWCSRCLWTRRQECCGQGSRLVLLRPRTRWEQESTPSCEKLSLVC